MAFVKIASYQASGSGITAITFSSIPSTYKDLYIVLSLRSGSVASRVGLSYTFNGVGGTSYTNQLMIGYDGGSLGAFRQTSQALSSEMNINAGGSSANTFGPATMYIPNYANTSNWKQVISDSVGENMSANPYVVDMSSALFMNTSAINQVQFSCSGNFQIYSQITLYGI